MADNAEWREELPEIFRDAPFIGKAESAEDALSKIVHAADYMGKAVRIPDADTPADKKDEFYKKIAEAAPDLFRLPDEEDADAQATFFKRLGRPDELTGYEAPTIDDWDWDKDYVTKMQTMAFEAGLSKRQFNQFMAGIANSGVASDAATELATGENVEALKKEWGAAYEDRMKLVTGYLALSKAPDSLTDLVKSGQMDQAGMDWLHEAAAQFTSDPEMIKQRKKAGDGGDGLMTPDEARVKIQEIMEDKAYFDSSNPRQKILIQRMVQLQTAAIG